MIVKVASELTRLAGVIEAMPGFIGLAKPMPKVMRTMRSLAGFFGSARDTDERPSPKETVPSLRTCRDTSTEGEVVYPSALQQ